jgi:hypothetical protein
MNGDADGVEEDEDEAEDEFADDGKVGEDKAEMGTEDMTSSTRLAAIHRPLKAAASTKSRIRGTRWRSAVFRSAPCRSTARSTNTALGVVERHSPMQLGKA